MLVFDETRMMSSIRGLSQFEDLVCRDRNHPASSCGPWQRRRHREYRQGQKILTAMKAWPRCTTARAQSQLRHGAIGTGGLEVCDVWLQLYGSGAEDFHKAHPDRPIIALRR